jgi:hypothetical protein
VIRVRGEALGPERPLAGLGLACMALWRSTLDVNLSPLDQVLLGEACRVAYRLARINAALEGAEISRGAQEAGPTGRSLFARGALQISCAGAWCSGGTR